MVHDLTQYPIKCDVPGWTHMRFKIATKLEFLQAHPCHRFYDYKNKIRYVAAFCSECPHHVPEVVT